MRQIPSVTEMTVPWLRISVCADKPWMRLLMSSEISAGLSCMTLFPFLSFFGWACWAGSRSLGQRNFHLFETGPHRGVEHQVANHHTNAPDEFGLDGEAEVEFAAESAF